MWFISDRLRRDNYRAGLFSARTPKALWENMAISIKANIHK